MSLDFGVVLSLVSFGGRFDGFDDVSRLVCYIDGLPCRDFVHCLRFRDFDGSVVLIWCCPRFSKKLVLRRT